ncbi:MAG: ATP-binding cassette domain-containing protein [Desulfobaccales bacterium]
MLRLEDICLRLGEFRLREISLNVKPGTYLGLLGPTGTGKTVLLETIAGVHTVSRGRIYIRGLEATHLAPEKRRLGIVYQDYALFPHLTVFENIAFGLRLQGRPRRNIHKAVEEMAAFLEVGPLLQRRPHRLSGGERQRVALARALVMEPYVLLLRNRPYCCGEAFFNAGTARSTNGSRAAAASAIAGPASRRTCSSIAGWSAP